MQLKIKTRDLERGLGRVVGAADKKGAIAILGSVVIIPSDTDLRLLATDMSLAATTSVPAGVVRKSYPWAVSAVRLYEVVKSLPSGDLAITAEDGDFLLEQGGAKYTIPALVLDKQDAYPRIPWPTAEAEWMKLPEGGATALLAIIARTEAAVLWDLSRPHLAGLRLHLRDPLTASATDSLRGAASSATLACEGSLAPVLVPAGAIDPVKKFLADVEAEPLRLCVESGYLTFDTPKYRLAVKLLEVSQSPSAERIRGMAKSLTTAVPVSASALASAARRLLLVGGAIASVELKKDALCLRARGDKGGGGEERIPLLQPTTPMPVVKVKTQFLVEALARLEGDVMLHLGGDVSPVAISQDGDVTAFSVLSPMKEG